ncbi:thioredoxin family protein [Undibacterium danionis]|uniref:Thioredoxin family protein n=1 Tax=Undibacterium danionis TaxID=1812100 RepID=A0ABV6I9A7_9BURK
MLTPTYSTDDLTAIKNQLQTKPWLVACLCAAWCDTCQSYRAGFDQLRLSHSDKCFAWIDIEDHANLVEEIDIENFPTILIQYEEKVLFFGTMLPDSNLVIRLLQAFEQQLNESGLEKIIPSIQSSDYPVDTNWSLRHLLLNKSD